MLAEEEFTPMSAKEAASWGAVQERGDRSQGRTELGWAPNVVLLAWDKE